MGFNMAERLRLAGHKVVGFDFNKTRPQTDAAGSLGVNSLWTWVKNLLPRALSGLWFLGDVDQTIARLEP